MAKNVRIDKSGTGEVGQYSGISMIKTELLEGGVQKWVPVDEYATYLKKGTVKIKENGTYLPADHNWNAFTEVTVEIGDNDNYNYDVDGSESDPGYSYTDPSTGLIVDPSDVPDNPTDNIKTNKYKGNGTIKGINPLTGEPTAVSTDANGNIQLNEIPSSIRVITPPGNTTYIEGDTIDYTGIEVGAFKADGSAFRLENGSGEDGNIIPFAELTFPTKKASTNPENENLPNETAPESGSSSGTNGSSSSGSSSGEPETPEVEAGG